MREIRYHLGEALARAMASKSSRMRETVLKSPSARVRRDSKLSCCCSAWFSFSGFGCACSCAPTPSVVAIVSHSLNRVRDGGKAPHHIDPILGWVGSGLELDLPTAAGRYESDLSKENNSYKMIIKLKKITEYIFNVIYWLLNGKFKNIQWGFWTFDHRVRIQRSGNGSPSFFRCSQVRLRHVIIPATCEVYVRQALRISSRARSTRSSRMQAIIPPPEIPKDPALEGSLIHRDSDYYERDSARSARRFMKTRWIYWALHFAWFQSMNSHKFPL